MIIQNIIFDKAIDKRNKEVLNLLLDNADENSLQNGQKRNLLRRIQYCFENDVDLWKKVLDVLKPDVNRYSCKNTALANLLESTYTKFIYERAKILIDYGAKVNKVDGSLTKLPALQHYLMFHSTYDDRIIDLLLANGADINAVNYQGNNYLMCQIDRRYEYYGYVEEVDVNETRRLINKYDLDITLPNKNGLTLLDFIEKSSIDIKEDLKGEYVYDQKRLEERLDNLSKLKSFYLSLTGGL